ncbi:hypothetical protein IEO21_11120 [Rhodonia placenta]|uniref:Uncharacterized protein n=1 Tax=Rhodonia placenta TaxID=104341 RepID=A0A8H7TVE9_9APHY|nr:hypothetical protein IEO21_11120 [Postia placenta]
MEQTATACDMGVWPTVLPDYEPEDDLEEIEWTEADVTSWYSV